MPVAVSDRFRQLVAGLTDAEGFTALMIHIRASSSEGFCPVCDFPMIPADSVDRECVYGDSCIHGKCTGCEHNSHYDQDQEPDVSKLSAADILGTQATLTKMVSLLDAGHHVAVRPL